MLSVHLSLETSSFLLVIIVVLGMYVVKSLGCSTIRLCCLFKKLLDISKLDISYLVLPDFSD